MNKPYISVVIPVYNESENLEQLYQRLISSLDKSGETYEIILVTVSYTHLTLPTIYSV